MATDHLNAVVDDKGICHIEKDPDSFLDYPVRLGNWLAADDYILSFTIVEVVGVTPDVGGPNISSIEDDPGIAGGFDADVAVTTASMVLMWVGGGDASLGVNQVTCRVVTFQGRTTDRTYKFKIREF